jgi:hypothetical protein
MRKMSNKHKAKQKRVRVANRQALPPMELAPMQLAPVTLAPVTAQDIRRIVAKLKEDESGR